MVGSLDEGPPAGLVGHVCLPVSSGSSVWTESEPAQSYASEKSSLYEPETHHSKSFPFLFSLKCNEIFKI